MSAELAQAWAARLGVVGVDPPEVGVAEVRYASRFGYTYAPAVDGATSVSPTSNPPAAITGTTDYRGLTTLTGAATRDTQATRWAAFHTDLYAWLTSQLPSVPSSSAVRTWVDAWTPPA